MTDKKKTRDAQFKNFSRQETIPFPEFLKLLERHFSSKQINEHVAEPKWSTWAHTFDHNIRRAFVDADIRVQGTRIYAGQSLAARLERLQSISRHANEILKLLTGEEVAKPENAEKISDDIWFYLHKNAVAKASPDTTLLVIRQFRSLVDLAAVDLQGEIDCGSSTNTNTRPLKSGRKRNVYTSSLLNELMSVWKEMTGSAPLFGVTTGKSTSKFAIFFADYFSPKAGPKGPNARAISDICLSLKKDRRKKIGS